MLLSISFHDMRGVPEASFGFFKKLRMRWIVANREVFERNMQFGGLFHVVSNATALTKSQLWVRVFVCSWHHLRRQLPATCWAV